MRLGRPRLKRLLRSPRIAVRLLLALSAYAVVATLIPQGGSTDRAVMKWGTEHRALEALLGPLGMHTAFSSPLFFMLITWLTLSTAVCAWERTAVVRGWFGKRGTVSEATIRRLKSHPDARLEVDGPDAVEKAEAALRSRGFSTTRGPVIMEARAGAIGLLGSPLFHWALVALFVFVVIGQSFRSSGRMGVMVGDSVLNAATEYRSLERGPLYFDGYKDLEFEVARFDEAYESNGVNFGVTPEVVIRRGENVVTRGWVRPNHPLRVGSLVVHDAGYGIAAQFRLLDKTGEVVSRLPVMVDFEGVTPQGTAPQRLGLAIDGRKVGDLEVVIPVDHTSTTVFRRPPADTRAVVSFRGEPTGTVRPGERINLGSGYELVFDDIVMFERLSVVDDWSVYAIYAAFALAGLGLTLSLFWSPRSVQVMLSEGESTTLNVVARHGRKDPSFVDWVVKTITQSQCSDFEN